MKVLLLTKTSEVCREIQDFIGTNVPKESQLRIIEGEFGDKFPDLSRWSGDYILSFLSPWIIPVEILDRSKISVNFHPAPSKYPGIGCYNFAIYDKEREYGVTCHHMISKVDSGKIVKVVRFPMPENPTVGRLKEVTMDYLVRLFHEILKYIINGQELPGSNETWARKPYTRKDLQELCRITKDMSNAEVKLRVRATYFPGARDLPYIEVNGEKTLLKE